MSFERRILTINFHLSSALIFQSQLSAMDASVRTTMKGAAKCDKHCKLQNSANQQNFERILRFQDMPESMPTSALHYSHVLGHPSSWVATARLCALARCPRAVADALSSPVRLRARNRLSASCTLLYLRLKVSPSQVHGDFFRPKHEVRSGNPLNLSI